MARAEQRPERSDRRTRPVQVLLFVFFPMLIGVGILAPGMVKVMAEEGATSTTDSVRITRRLSRFAHQPLLLPRDFSAGFVPELLDLEHLFQRVEYMRDPRIFERARLPSFPRTYGDVIVLDDVDQRIREIVFKDPVLLAATASTALPPPAPELLPLPGPGVIGPGPRFDDFFGPQVEVSTIVPEPSTGLLLGMGLAVIGLLRRRC
ncbi:MAG: PEP-CTERM sorting domain-containing protein [Myxococcota bacterium]